MAAWNSCLLYTSRFVSAFTIVAGAIILASSVAGTRFGRVREVVILKTLGATRRRVAGIFSMEFLVLGGAAGLLGSAPVSYTHLDVYKRQHDNCARRRSGPRRLSSTMRARAASPCPCRYHRPRLARNFGVGFDGGTHRIQLSLSQRLY